MDGTIAGSNCRRLQVRPVRKDGWTKEKRAAFLDMLATSCNVRESARSVGLHVTGAYHLRRRDAEFAALWRDAILAGYERLEEMLLAHAGVGVNDIAIGETEIEPAPFDPNLALELLRHHKPLVENRRKPMGGRLERADRAEAEAALLKKLDGLSRRQRSEQGE